MNTLDPAVALLLKEAEYPLLSDVYPKDFTPDAAYRASMPDLQNGPASLIRGSRRMIQHVGISNFRLPIRYRKRDGGEMTLESAVTGTVSLEAEKKGINMSRIMRSFYAHAEKTFSFEVIEAAHLWRLPAERIGVLVHRQSIVHGMVEFVDGSMLAELGPPDMRLPIALGLGWPDRVAGAAQPCDWSKATSWTFEPLDTGAFPAVGLAKEAARRGSTFPAVFNAANEEAVMAFHAGRIRFTDIVDTIEAVLSEHSGSSGLTVESVLDAERWARARTLERLSVGTA
mgnify:CR=1 FL=1